MCSHFPSRKLRELPFFASNEIMDDQDPPYLPPGHDLAGVINPFLALFSPKKKREFDLKSVEDLTVGERSPFPTVVRHNTKSDESSP